MKTGVLLINLGTPNSPSVKDVRTYLREFLSDPYVIDIHPLARFLLLNLIILPFRSKKSALAYQSIWTEQGSPLLINSKALASNTQQLLMDDYQIALGMRYGKPNIKQALAQLKMCRRLLILPLFPQYSLAATETALVQAQTLAEQLWQRENIKIIKDFYVWPSFIEAQAKLIYDYLGERKFEQIIFSYHGLPERQVKKTCKLVKCDMLTACPAITVINRDCYRDQCFATSHALARQLNLNKTQYITAFQSRLGGAAWIQPYTDKVLEKLAKQNVKNIAIVCPSFVVDCLETLEEIGIRARIQWQTLGGENLYLIPALNTSADWLVDLIKANVC